MKTTAVLLLVGVFLNSVLLYKAIASMPLQELRRRARVGKDVRTQAIYKLAAYESSLAIFLWLLAGIGGTVLLVLVAHISLWLALIFMLLLSWFLLGNQFFVRPGSWLWQIAGLMAVPAAYVLSFLQPVLSRAGGLIKNLEPHLHTGIYEKEDLLDLLRRQSGLVDNRISEAELKAARGALSFGDKTVMSVMTPRTAVTWVSRDDTISPKLMDDLHKTGHIRFPVTVSGSQPTNPEVVGILYLTDLLKNLEKSGVVGGIMKKDAHFINESHSLAQALDGFLKSGQHLLIVVNNFEEVVGVLSIEDVISQILGQKITDEFDGYGDKRAVAGHEAKNRDGEPIEAKVE